MKDRREQNPLALGELHRFVPRLVEIRAVLDEPRTEGAHRRVLLGAVAVRHDDRHRNAEPRAGISQRIGRDCRASPR